MQIHGLDPSRFLETYWQKKPLLLRGAFPAFASPLEPDDLAGLACEEGVSARLILEQGGAYPWQLLHGPFDESVFAELPETHWSLLVQEVDRYAPDVAALLDAFRFIPAWRLDDVMVSYAPAGGSVGAHIDQYDVFLLQGYGRRRWQIETAPKAEELLVPELDVRLLQDFAPDAEWVLEPGDMLYLPPRVAHHGVALDDCMTYSIGFRAPSHAEIVLGFMQHAADALDPRAWYGDPDLRVQPHHGEISPAALERVAEVLQRLVAEPGAVGRWFGGYATESRRGMDTEPLDAPYTAAELQRALEAGLLLAPSPLARMAFARLPGGVSVFTNGRELALPEDLADFAALVTARRTLAAAEARPWYGRPEAMQALTHLVNEGAFEALAPEEG